MSEVDEMVAGTRVAVSGARWPEPGQVRARGDQRGERRRLAAVTAAVAGVLVLAAAVVLGPATHRPQPPAGTVTPAPTSTASPATSTRPAVLRQGSITHAVDPLSMTSGHGSLWLAFRAAPIASPGATPGPGELVRVDTQTLKVTAQWPIVGSPEALVVTDHYVWVAGDIFDGRPPAQNANHVQQFDLAGKLLHTYAIDSPTGMAGQGDSVWIEYGPPSHSGYLAHLHDGVIDPPVLLSGTNTIDSRNGRSLTVCPDGIYAATADDQGQATYVDRVVTAGPAAPVKLPVQGLTVLGCGAGGGALAVTPDPNGTTVQQVSVDGPRPAVTLPGFSRALGFDAGELWIGLQGSEASTTRVWRADQSLLGRGGTLTIPGDSLTIPIDVVHAVMDEHTLWALGADPHQPNTWTMIAIAQS
jgi:hypothetical protein